MMSCMIWACSENQFKLGKLLLAINDDLCIPMQDGRRQKLDTTFRVGILTWGGVLVGISDWELGNSDFPVQMERSI